MTCSQTYKFARCVVRHAIAFIAGLPDFLDAIRGAPPAAHIAGHVAEVQALFLRIPDGPFRKPKARAEFFDGCVLINQLEHLRRFDFDGFDGFIHSVFTPPECPSSSADRIRQACVQPKIQLQAYLRAKLYSRRQVVSNPGPRGLRIATQRQRLGILPGHHEWALSYTRGHFDRAKLLTGGGFSILGLPWHGIRRNYEVMPSFPSRTRG